MLGKLLYALSEETHLLENLLEHFNILVTDWLLQKIIQVESARDDEHEALVEAGCDLEEDLVVVGEIERVVLDIVDHPDLLVVEELPDFINRLEVLPRNFVEVALLSGQLLLILLHQHLVVEAEEPLDLGRIVCLQAVDVVEEVVEHRQQPLVQLGPVRREVLLHEDAGDSSQLVVSSLRQYAFVWVLNQRQDFLFQVVFKCSC